MAAATPAAKAAAAVDSPPNWEAAEAPDPERRRPPPRTPDPPLNFRDLLGGGSKASSDPEQHLQFRLCAIIAADSKFCRSSTIVAAAFHLISSGSLVEQVCAGSDGNDAKEANDANDDDGNDDNDGIDDNVDKVGNDGCC